MPRRTLLFAALGAILIGCSVYDVSLLGGAIGGPGVGAAGSGNDNGGTGGEPPSAGTGPSVGNGGRPGVTVSTAGRAGESSGGADPNGGSGGSPPSTGGMGGDTDPGGGTAGEGGTENNGGTTVDTGGEGGTDTGGSSGAGGSGLAGGGTSSGGVGGMGGIGGVGGAGGSGGTGGSPTFTGCAVLETALDAEADKAHFLITLAGDTDFTGATVSLHVYAIGALGGSLSLYVQQSSFEYWGSVGRDLTTFSGWTTIDWDVGSETTTGVDKTLIRRLGIEVNGDGGTTWSNPTTVYVDSITVTTAALSFTFDTTATVFATPVADRTADRAMWLNNGSSDTTALTGSSIAWSTTCP